MRVLLLLAVLPSVALAQLIPLRLPQYAEPPEANGANPITYPNGILWNLGRTCVQRSSGPAWDCLATSSDVNAVNVTAVAAQSAAASAQTTANGAASAASSAQATADGAQASATSAGTSAATAQATANAAQSASTANAAAVAALQAQTKRLCASFTVAAGVSVPLTGISTVQNIPLPGVPVGAVCDTGAPTRMPLGARPDPVVTSAGTVAMAFVSNAGLLSSLIAIPSGTYKVCCDTF